MLGPFARGNGDIAQVTHPAGGTAITCSIEMKPLQGVEDQLKDGDWELHELLVGLQRRRSPPLEHGWLIEGEVWISIVQRVEARLAAPRGSAHRL